MGKWPFGDEGYMSTYAMPAFENFMDERPKKTGSWQDVMEMVQMNETDGSDAQVYGLSHAGSGKSGWSFSRFQGDTKNNRHAKEALLQGMAGAVNEQGESLFGPGELATIGQAFTDGDPAFREQPEFAKVNNWLGSPQGRKVVDVFDRQHGQTLVGQTQQVLNAMHENPRAEVDQAYAAGIDDFVNKVLLTDYISQLGFDNPNIISPAYEGEVVSLKSGDFKFHDETPGFEAQTRYESRQIYGQTPEGRAVMRGRRQKLNKNLLTHGFISPNQYLENEKTIQCNLSPLDKVPTGCKKPDSVLWVAEKQPKSDGDFLDRILDGAIQKHMP